MQIWLRQGEDALRLPINPASFEVETSQNNTSVTVNKIGEVKLLGKGNLHGISFSSFFPKKEYSFVQYSGFPAPYECVKKIKSFMGAPVKLTMTGTDLTGLVTIENFSYSEADGTGDVAYSLELAQYRKPKIVKAENKTVSRETKTVTLKATERETKAVNSTSYTVRAGDTLYSIAKKLTGNAENWRAIANQNNITNVRALQIGTVLAVKV